MASSRCRSQHEDRQSVIVFLLAFLEPHSAATLPFSKGNCKSGYYDRTTPEKFFGVSLAYVRSLEDSQRPVEVSCDVSQHLVAYRTAVETRTNSSGMRTHTGQHSRLPCMHILIFAGRVVHSVQKSYQN